MHQAYSSAEVTRSIWKPAFMNRTDWPRLAANSSIVEQHNELRPRATQSFRRKTIHVVRISVGDEHAVVLDSSGFVYTWGKSCGGALGHGGETDETTLEILGHGNQSYHAHSILHASIHAHSILHASIHVRWKLLDSYLPLSLICMARVTFSSMYKNERTT